MPWGPDPLDDPIFGVVLEPDQDVGAPANLDQPVLDVVEILGGNAFDRLAGEVPVLVVGEDDVARGCGAAEHECGEKEKGYAEGSRHEASVRRSVR
jgi:hypothetical protein